VLVRLLLGAARRACRRVTATPPEANTRRLAFSCRGIQEHGAGAGAGHAASRALEPHTPCVPPSSFAHPRRHLLIGCGQRLCVVYLNHF
jgi:hypothetical protein